MRRHLVSILVIIACAAPVFADDPPKIAAATKVSLAYVETNQPRLSSGGGMTGAIQRVVERMSQLRQSTAVLDTAFVARIKRPERSSDPWVLRLEVEKAELRLGAGLSAKAAEQARVDADTVRERLRGWRRELDESEVFCLLTSGGLSCTVASPFKNLAVLRGGPGIVAVHYSTVDISGDWEIVGEPGAILTIAQSVGKIDAKWKALPKQAAALSTAGDVGGMDLPVAPPRFVRNPPRDRRSVGGSALRGVLSKRNLQAELWLAQTAETGSIDLELTPQGDLLEGTAWIPQPVNADRDSAPFRSERFALRRVRANRPDVEVRFVARSANEYFYDIDAIPYAEPFWVEVTYRKPPSMDRATVKLGWGGPETFNLPVFVAKDDPNVFRSKPLHAEKDREGSGR